MAKRLNPKKVRFVLTYTVPELAFALGITEPTVRAMINRGMPAMTSVKPTLVLGADAREFIERENAIAKKPLKDDELFCLSCKTPRRPLGMLVDVIKPNSAPFRIVGLCEVCAGTCSRTIAKDNLAEIETIFDTGTSTAK